MKYLSVCSGIEAATCAWHDLGFQPVAFAEIEKFPCAVLAHHYPAVPNWGDMTKYKEWPNEAVDLLVGGTPCQSFSVAGLRKGLKDPRGNLMLTFLGIADKYKPQWIVWENVPGVLSSNKGRDFGTFLGALAELGYGWAYRVLDAQYFGVPQRRRRVFVVGCFGEWRRAAEVLFEPESLPRNPPPSRKAGEGVAGNAAIGVDEECNATIDGFGPLLKGGQGGTRQAVCYGGNNQVGPISVATTLSSHSSPSGRQDFASETFVASGRSEYHEGDQAGPLRASTDLVAFTQNQSGDVLTTQSCPSMGTNQNATGRNTPKVQSGMTVRRLTSKECERLQGFPDDYTMIPWRKGMAPDGPRYKALGNSMAVPVMRWIGERIQDQ